jgi:hypothetical protein
LTGRAAREATIAADGSLIFDGGDIFFTPAGGEAYLKDLPEAEMHRLQSGHFCCRRSSQPYFRGDEGVL